MSEIYMKTNDKPQNAKTVVLFLEDKLSLLHVHNRLCDSTVLSDRVEVFLYDDC